MDIIELLLPANNLEETERFYAQLLEFDIVHKEENSISFLVGSSKLIFYKADHPSNYHFAFNIPKNKLEEAIEWILQKTELIKVENNSYITDFENWNAQAVYFYDNEQNILEFITRADLCNLSSEAFSVKSILNISEIGIVDDEPLKLAEQIIAQTQLDYFEKGPKREDFVALGDDNGLFVISNPHRNWYPTGIKAVKYPVKTRIQWLDNVYELEFNLSC